MELFRKSVKKHRTQITEYDAKIFGGGNLIKKVGDNTQDSIGTKNAAAAMMLLMQEGVAIKIAHVGEFGHRRIVFDISSGDVWVKHEPLKGVNTAILSGRK